MPANVQTMAYVGEVPWHGQGVRVREMGLANAAEMIVAAGLDWRVALMETETFYWIDDPSGAVALGPDGKFAPAKIKVYLPNATKSVVRLDNYAILDEGVSTRFTPYQNEEMFAWVDGIVGAAGAVYHTAGALGDGSEVWVLVELPGDVYIGGKDEYKKYILIFNSHKRGRRLKFLKTFVRAVCQNTVALALEGAAMEDIAAISHMPNINARAEAAKGKLCLINAHYNQMEELFNALTRKQVSAATVKAGIEVMWPMPGDEARSEGADQRREQVKRLREKTEQFFDSGVGADVFAGSLYNLGVTAPSEAITHLRGRRTGQAQLQYATVGDGAAAQERALQFARQLLG